MIRFPIVVLAGIAAAGFAGAQQIGVNVLLASSPSAGALAQLSAHGQVLEVIPEINAVRLSAQQASLAAVQALPCVIGACRDEPCTLASLPDVPVPDFAQGSNLWNLDAVNVTDFGTTRTVAYDGAG